MEEETRRNFPSLPPNFVSLQMLKERRELEQKQREEEEEEEQRRFLEEEKERLRKEEEAKKIHRSPKVQPRNRAEIGARASPSTPCNRKNCDWKREQGESKSKSKRFNRESKISVAVAAEAERDESKLKRFNQGSEIAVAEQEIAPDLQEKYANINQRPRRKRYDNKKKKNFKESKAEEEIANGDPNNSSEDRHVKIQTHQAIATTETTGRHVKTRERITTSTSETTTGSNQVSEIVHRVAMISVVDHDDRKADEKHCKIAEERSMRRGPPWRRTEEMEPRIDDRTVDDKPNKIRMNRRHLDSGGVMNGGRGGFRSCRKFGCRGGSANLVWIKKEES